MRVEDRDADEFTDALQQAGNLGAVLGQHSRTGVVGQCCCRTESFEGALAPSACVLRRGRGRRRGQRDVQVAHCRTDGDARCLDVGGVVGACSGDEQVHGPGPAVDCAGRVRLASRVLGAAVLEHVADRRVGIDVDIRRHSLPG